MVRKVSGVMRRVLSLKGVIADQPQVMGGATMMGAIPDNLAALAVYDPQYRTVLDRQKYGNEGKRQAARAKLPSQTDADIINFVHEIERLLRPSGHLMLWMDKFCMASGHYHRWVRRAFELEIVDLIAWNKMRPGMGARARCATEYCVILQKQPTRAKGIWTDHRLMDCWAETSDRDQHTHAKPAQLTERLIRTMTKRGDLVVDPCAGGYGVLDACRLTGRHFLGCDLLPLPEHHHTQEALDV